MPTKSDDIAGAILQLGDKASAKRRSAAKALRKAGRIEAGPPLIAALDREIRDGRTWETQYQIIMALGECGVTDALPLLYEIASMELEATSVLAGVGDAVTRLEHQSGQPFRSLSEWLTVEETRLAAEAEAQVATRPGAIGRILGRAAWNRLAGPSEPPPSPDVRRGGRPEALVEGGLQAIAMMRLVPDNDFINRLIRHASTPVNEWARFFVALACAGWDGEDVAIFLRRCLDSPLENTRLAARASLEKKYYSWQPL